MFFPGRNLFLVVPPPRQGSAFCRGLKQKLCGGGQQNTVKQRSEGLPAFPSPAANPVHVGKWLPTGSREEEGPLLGFRHRIGEISRLKKKPKTTKPNHQPEHPSPIAKPPPLVPHPHAPKYPPRDGDSTTSPQGPFQCLTTPNSPLPFGVPKVKGEPRFALGSPPKHKDNPTSSRGLHPNLPAQAKASCSTEPSLYFGLRLAGLRAAVTTAELTGSSAFGDPADHQGGVGA